MPRKRNPGRRRLEIAAEPEFIELVTRAARESGVGGLSAWCRQALTARLRKDGYELPEVTVRPAHRPPGKDPA